MSKILKVRNVNDYGRYLGCAERHPLVSVIDYAEVSPIRHSLNNYSVYGLFLRDDAEVELDYGCGKYDYNKGTLLCVAPRAGGNYGLGVAVPSRPAARISAGKTHPGLFFLRLPRERSLAHDR